jgi:glycolate oxidase
MKGAEMISDAAYAELEGAVGPENVSREPAVLDSYSWQPFANNDPERWVIRPVAVALPASTEEVQALVKAIGRNGLKFKAFSTGWGAYSSPTSDGVVQVDLRRMDRIIDIDEKNMYAVLEPYVCGAQLQAEAMKVGLNTHIIGAGPSCSPLASATSAWGVGWDCVYMSYSGRNLLGAEWVLPDGEVLRLGTLGSGKGWFCGDGPGPSLRGIVRGSTGALSGLGIFTKAAIKLYNWPGPPQVKTEGLLLDARSEVPENLRFCMCFWPDRASQDEAIYKINESQLCYIFSRTGLGSTISIATPHLMKILTKTKAIRDTLTGDMKWGCTLIMVADSAGEMAYKEGVLAEIARRYGGAVINLNKAKPLISMFLMNFLRSTAVPVVFRMGGQMFTALDRNDTWDSQMDWADAGEVIKQRWIDKGGILDDMADNPYMVSYEDNTWGHCEEIFQYDPRNPEHLASLEPLFVEFSVEAAERCMEPLSSTDARLRKVISPMMGNYTRWQQRISGFMDSEGAADTGMYCDEVDFDFDELDPAMRARLEKLLDKFSWTEEGPPE